VRNMQRARRGGDEAKGRMPPQYIHHTLSLLASVTYPMNAPIDLVLPVEEHILYAILVHIHTALRRRVEAPHETCDLSVMIRGHGGEHEVADELAETKETEHHPIREP
jgi:hypothetical protein